MDQRAVLYARVSLEIQDTDDRVSIDQQLADMRTLCERNGWQVVGTFVDRENYRATQRPRKGKIVNPSGERADRPALLAMLQQIKAGKPDAVLCWRDDRLVRHPRVAVALEDALDRGDAARPGRDKIQLYDATGAVIDRFVLSIKAAIWREENKRWKERSKLGKMATLQQGRWPSGYRRWGYKNIKEPGQRGSLVVPDPETAPFVRQVYEMYAAGAGPSAIRTYLIAHQVPQIYAARCKHQWSPSIIHSILRDEAYLGQAVWRFKDGTTITVGIPQLVDPDLWQRVQERCEREKREPRRASKRIHPLKGILRCGDCGNGTSVSTWRRARSSESYTYRCHTADHHPEEPHPRPASKNGPQLDWAVWRRIVDYGITRPDLIRAQMQLRQTELQTHGHSLGAEIAHAQQRLAAVADERAFYQRQAARGQLTEDEFDRRMAETGEAQRYWQDELDRLGPLRDAAAAAQANLDHVTELLTALQDQLSGIDQPPDELEALPDEKRWEVMAARQKIIRTLCDTVYMYADGRVRIEGVLDGSEAAQFELED